MLWLVFQVEPILWLQHHAGAAGRAVMELVSLLGLSPAYAAFAIVVAFFVRMRPATLLVLMLLSTAVLVDGAKTGFALPRPDQVDARVLGPRTAVIERGGASGPWALPPSDTIEAVRAAPRRDWGFPSGHVASATTFALAVRMLLAWRGAAWFASLWIPLMALSRLTLGRHFVADVLGGFALGLGVFAIGSRVIAWLEANPERARRMTMILPAVAILSVALAWVSGVPNPRFLGSLAGVALVAWVCSVRGWPAPAHRPTRRAGQCAVALVLYAAGAGALRGLSPGDGWVATATAVLVATALLLPHRMIPARSVSP
jgi:membrane-associated phospholipid phosphatase